jgi:hypothetical protein
MKKLLLFGFLLVSPCFAQTTNFVWSANFTSNYIRTSMVAYVNAALLTNNLARSNSTPYSTLLSGITTNVPAMPYTNPAGGFFTNWLCITNGVVLRVTNNVP